MRQIKFFLFFFTILVSTCTLADIQQRIAIFTQQTELFKEICFTPSGVFYENKVLFDVKGSIRETVMDCNAQALALEAERQAIEATLQRENCEEQSVTDSGLIDLLSGSSPVVQEISCPGIGNATACTQDLACNLTKSIIPLGSALLSQVMPNDPILNRCSAGESCLTNIGKAIWDNLWDTVTGIYDLGKMGVNWIGEKIGSLWESEDATSTRGIAATEISDSELDKFIDDPIGYVADFGSRLIDMITQGISSRYGCAEWTGTPHLSECIRPMSWECGTCKERLNMICGVTSYVGSTLITAFFTGGATAAVQISSKVATSAVISVAKTIPGAARLAETMSVAGKLGRGASLVSGTLKNVWSAVARSRTVQGVSAVASKLKTASVAANDFARKNVLFYAAGQDAVVNSVKAYNRLATSAFRLGYESTGRAASHTRTYLYAQYPKLSDITSGRYAGVSTTEGYLREATKGMSAQDRASMRMSITTDAAGEKRVVIHDTRAGEVKSDVAYNFTPERAPAAAKTPPPLPVTNIDTVVVRPPSIADEVEMIHGLGGKKLNDEAARAIESAMERRVAEGGNAENFLRRQIIVREALEKSGFTHGEALATTEKLFRSGALGRTPPPSEMALLMRSPVSRAASDATQAEKTSSMASSERAIVSHNREEYIENWGGRRATSPHENGLYIDSALKGKEPGLFFLDTQNTALKHLNDTLRDKSLVDAFGNRYNNLVQEALKKFKEKYPDISITMYSDYKSLRGAIRGPPGKETELMEELAKMMDEAGSQFVLELKASNIPLDNLQSDQWFRAGLGRSADEANLVTRFSRRETDTNTTYFASSSAQERINNAWQLSELTRKNLATRFEGTPLLQSSGSAKIPTAEVLEVVRKNENAQDVARILSGRYGTEVSVKDAELLKQYFNQVDQFSPGLLITERVEHNFGNAVHGGFSVDFAGVGSVNAEATAMGLASGKNLEEAITIVRQREITVTRDLDALKSRTENAVRTVLDRHGISAQITISGDDMLVVPNKILTPEVRRELALAQVKAQAGTSTLPSGMRTSFFSANIPNQTARSIQATIGETIEKKLRKRLEGVLTPEELKQTLFAIDMKGTTPGAGNVGVEVINSKLSPKSRQIIDQEFQKAVQDINRELRNSGQTGTLNQTNSSLGLPFGFNHREPSSSFLSLSGFLWV